MQLLECKDYDISLLKLQAIETKKLCYENDVLNNLQSGSVEKNTINNSYRQFYIKEETFNIKVLDMNVPLNMSSFTFLFHVLF